MIILYKKNGTASVKIPFLEPSKYNTIYITIQCRSRTITSNATYCVNHVEFTFDPRNLECGTYILDIYGYNTDSEAKTFLISDTLQILN